MSKQEANAPHPRREPRLPGPLSLGRLEEVFSDCVDFAKREVYLHGDSQRKAVVCYIDGQARSERLNDYVLRPLAQDPMLASVPESQAAYRDGSGGIRPDRWILRPLSGGPGRLPGFPRGYRGEAVRGGAGERACPEGG